MSSQYQKNLIEAVGSSLYYYTNHKNIDLTNNGAGSFDQLKIGWVNEYHGSRDLYNNPNLVTYNTFKPCVDQLVCRIIDATEKEIDERVAERVNDYISKMNLINS